MIRPFIMLVDDEIPFVETMVKRLSKRNLKVIFAFSGSEALEKLDKNRDLDVIVLDLKMPSKNGMETLSEIKKKYPLCEVIMLTGHGTVQSAIEGMKLGAYDYLMKPCDTEKLMLKVSEAAKKRRDNEEKIKEAMVKKVLSDYGTG